MGEMADFCNEYQEATVDQAYAYLRGEMGLQEAFDMGIIDALGTEQFPSHLIDSCDTPWGADSQLGSFIPYLERLSSSSSLSSNSRETARWLRNLAQFYRERGFLSKKQEAIVESNFPQGVERFKQLALISK